MYKKHTIEGYTRSELIEMINEKIVGYNAERNRKVLSRRLCDGITYECLAEEFDISVNQVKRIVYNGIVEILKKASGKS